MKKDPYERAEKIVKRISDDAVKLIRFENYIDRINDSEIRFQAKVAVMNHCRETM